MIWYICAKQFSEIPPNSYISPPLYHRRLLFKLDTLLRSHLVVEVIIQRGICTAPPPPILYSTPPSLMLRWMQNSTSRWCHQSVCLVLTIEVYGCLYNKIICSLNRYMCWFPLNCDASLKVGSRTFQNKIHCPDRARTIVLVEVCWISDRMGLLFDRTRRRKQKLSLIPASVYFFCLFNAVDSNQMFSTNFADG